ncbi:MAG: CPBP family intramembrane metalloprotease [Deltaproteobacteria bacterium]|nr:CPBP family intramembrane metalloprotease [Deltaproteobacteria bacterium]
MTVRDVLTVYRKELRETLRDRRTLAVMILLPLVLYPITTVVMSEWFLSREMARQARSSRVELWGQPDDTRSLEESFHASDLISLEVHGEPLPKSPPPASRLKDADVIIDVPGGFKSDMASGRSVAIEVYFDGARDDSELGRSRAEEILAKFGEAERSRRLADRGLDPGLTVPVTQISINVASKAQLGRAELAKTIPFFVVLMALLGSFYPAIDLTAGEKERGTLESLLATPMSRKAIVAGKYLTVSTISALTALLNVICVAVSALWIARVAAQAGGDVLSMPSVVQAVPWVAVSLALLGLLGATLLFSGIMMAIAALARNFKEAQNFLTPVHMVLSVPAMAAFLPGTQLDLGNALMPVANVTLLIKGAISGHLEAGPTALALVVILVLAVGSMLLAARVFDSERLLFAPDDPEVKGNMRRWLRRMIGLRSKPEGEAPPELLPAEALALYGLVLVLMISIGTGLQGNGLWGLAWSQWLLVAMPTLLLARLRGGVKECLSVRAPTPRHLLGAVLCGGSAWYVLGWAILPLQEYLAPTPKELSESLEQLIAPDGESLWLMFFAVSITPAFCEELLCRGALLRAFRGTLGASFAVLVSALLFSALHMSAYRFVPTFLLGLLLGFSAIRSGSLVPAITIHALNNGAVVLLQTHSGQSVRTLLEEHSHSFGFLSLGCFFLGLRLMTGRETGIRRLPGR